MYSVFSIGLTLTVALTISMEILTVYSIVSLDPHNTGGEITVPYFLVGTLLSSMLATYFWFFIKPEEERPDTNSKQIIDKTTDFPEWIEQLPLNLFQKRIIKKAAEQSQNLPSPAEVEETLKRENNSDAQTANPLLQPIAFAIKPNSGFDFVEGVVYEIAVWAVMIPWLPFLLLIYRFVSPSISRALFGTLVKKAIALSRYAKRYRLRSHNKLIKDTRTPILYLRPFSEDLEGVSERYIQKTPEERIAAFLRPKGPVIAIGKPKEGVPLLGAYRIYFDDAVWQAGVLYLMSISQLVVINAGVSLGTLWEIAAAKKAVAPDKLNISFATWEDLDLYERQEFYNRFKTYAEIILAIRMPEYIGKATVMYFDNNWNPFLHPSQN